jgi:hypothetical protein
MNATKQQAKHVADLLSSQAMFWLQTLHFNPSCEANVGRDSSVGIATSYGLDDTAGGGQIFCTSPGRPWGPARLPYNGYRVFPGGKAAGMWRRPSTPSNAEVK